MINILILVTNIALILLILYWLDIRISKIKQEIAKQIGISNTEQEITQERRISNIEHELIEQKEKLDELTKIIKGF